MRKTLLVIGCLFIILQLILISIDQYSEYFSDKTTTSDLTSFMTPFKHINRNSTFSCSEATLKNQYKLEFKQLKHYRLNQTYEQPSINSLLKQYITPALPKLPYFYSLWKTSSLLPRLMAPCEHQVYINLLKIFDQICQRNNIEYMISHGTLLGSYRNHDILPYDDDADILVNAKHYSQLAKINKSNKKMDWQFYLRSRKNMKFYFRASPSAGSYGWNWPFIGIQFYTDNLTHIRLNTYIEKDLIFPLILRPIASLWLPGPRNVHKYLSKLRKNYFIRLSIDEKCMSQAYSHRDEKLKYKKKVVNCSQLYNAYPYIRRICDNDYCHEHFMINNRTTLYVLKVAKYKK